MQTKQPKNFKADSIQHHLGKGDEYNCTACRQPFACIISYWLIYTRLVCWVSTLSLNRQCV